MFDHFSLAAPFYDRLAGVLDVTRLREHLNLPSRRLLDAGGGTGRVAQALRGLAGEIVVADISPAMLRRAATKDGLSTVRAHAEWLPFPDESFDRIIIVDAFHHLYDQQTAMADLWRVLTTGGRLVIEEPNIETWPVKVAAVAERLALMRSRFFSPPQMAEMLRGVGGQVRVHTDHAFNAWIIADKVQS